MTEAARPAALVLVNGRYVGLDFARSVFIVLGVLYHAALVFVTPQSYRVTSSEVGVGFDYLVGFIHDFRMYGFFLLSGFFYGLLIERRGRKPALVDRLQRLLVPTFFVGLSFNTVMTLYSPNYQYSATFAGYLLNGEWLGHLWFIGNLALYCLVLGPLLPRVLAVRDSTMSIPLAGLVLIIVVGTATPLLGMLFGVIGRPGPLLFLSPYEFLHYLPYFLAGTFFYARKDVFAFVIQLRVALPLTLLSRLGVHLIESTHAEDQWLFHLIRPFEAGYQLGLALLIIGLLQRVGRPSAFVNRTVIAGYTIYLMHEPMIAVLAPQLTDLAWPLAARFAMLSGATLVASYAIHVLLVQRSPFLRFLVNGVRPAPAPAAAAAVGVSPASSGSL